MGEWALIGNSIVITCDYCGATNVFPMTEDKALTCRACGSAVKIDFRQQYKEVVEQKQSRGVWLMGGSLCSNRYYEEPAISPYFIDGYLFAR